MDHLSREEINIRRLLSRCELMAKDDPHKDWKLEKYILALDDMIKQLQSLPSKPSKDTMIGYIKRIDFLKGLINTTKLTSPVDRVAAVQMLPKSVATFNDSLGPNITTQIHQKTAAKYNRELRAELFHTDKGTLEDGVRQRLSSTNMQDDDLDALLKYNRNIQEKIAENMLSMTSSMKEHALAANAIIKKDIGVLERTDKLTDVNTAKLKTESLKLQEHTQSYWRCWMWVMIAFVLVVFFKNFLVSIRYGIIYEVREEENLGFKRMIVLYIYRMNEREREKYVRYGLCISVNCARNSHRVITIIIVSMSTAMSTSVATPVPPKPIRKPGKVKVVKALYNYTAQRPDELSFEEGELLYIYDNNAEPNWWKAKCGDREGLVPANYVEEQTEEICLPLHDAARRGNVELLKEYIKEGISGTSLDKMGNMSLYWAAHAGHLNCVMELLNLPTSVVNVQNKLGETPLHAAASRGHLEVVNLLLQSGANPRIKNIDGLTADRLASDLSIKNAIQLSQRDSNKVCGYTDDDYNDDSD